MDPHLAAWLRDFRAGGGRITVLTGAGISAESGIPTFRGAEGYWTAGSRHYIPEEIATYATFKRDPALFWGWYLSRFRVCATARPNPAHRAVAAWERAYGERFTLITQNIDGLHLRAGNSPERTYRIHGDMGHMRCAGACTAELHPLPARALEGAGEDDPGMGDPGRAGAETLALLACPRCGGLCRPHVLLFDEYYDEEHYKYASSIAAARATDLLLLVGTSGATALPERVVRECFLRPATIVEVNPEETVFTSWALKSPRGARLAGKASEALAALGEWL